MDKGKRLIARLAEGDVLLADGATGTTLQAEGLEPGQSPESWLFERPDRIRALHQSYVEAGSDIILTTSFGGTHYRLHLDRQGASVHEANLRAATLAREVVDSFASAHQRTLFVAGDMGPTGKLMRPFGPLTPEAVSDAFGEQAEGLVAGGVDFLLIETMSDLGEAQAAVEGVRRMTSIPVIATFSFDTHGRTMMGLAPSKAAQEMAPLVQGIGANCGADPAEFPAIIEAMREAAPGTFLWAKPNAGLPQLVQDRVVYQAGPAYMAEIALRLRQAGAQVIGGCCGTTALHVAAMAEALRRGT